MMADELNFLRPEIIRRVKALAGGARKGGTKREETLNPTKNTLVAHLVNRPEGTSSLAHLFRCSLFVTLSKTVDVAAFGPQIFVVFREAVRCQRGKSIHQRCFQL